MGCYDCETHVVIICAVMAMRHVVLYPRSCKPDRGRTVVFFNTNDYVFKITNILGVLLLGTIQIKDNKISKEVPPFTEK